MRYWLLAENVDEIDRTLPYCLNAERVYRSVDWQQFQQDSQAKRELGNKSNKFNHDALSFSY